MVIGKKELTEKVAEGMGISKAAAAEAVNTVIGAIVDSVVAGEKVHLVGVGTFGVKERPARTAKNPRTGETVEVPVAKVPYFKPGKAFKDAVNN